MQSWFIVHTALIVHCLFALVWDGNFYFIEQKTSYFTRHQPAVRNHLQSKNRSKRLTKFSVSSLKRCKFIYSCSNNEALHYRFKSPHEYKYVLRFNRKSWPWPLWRIDPALHNPTHLETKVAAVKTINCPSKEKYAVILDWPTCLYCWKYFWSLSFQSTPGAPFLTRDKPEFPGKIG